MQARLVSSHPATLSPQLRGAIVPYKAPCLASTSAQDGMSFTMEPMTAAKPGGSIFRTCAEAASMAVAAERPQAGSEAKADMACMSFPLRLPRIPNPFAGAPHEKTHLQESSTSSKRDLLLGVTAVGTHLLPPPLNIAVGVVGGGLAAVTGYGEMREGLDRGSPHEVVDGALHMAAGALIGATSLPGGIGDAALAGSVSVLAVKEGIDHPIKTVWTVGSESASLVRDAITVVEHESKRSAEGKKTPEKAEKKPAPAPVPDWQPEDFFGFE